MGNWLSVLMENDPFPPNSITWCSNLFVSGKTTHQWEKERSVVVFISTSSSDSSRELTSKNPRRQNKSDNFREVESLSST